MIPVPQSSVTTVQVAHQTQVLSMIRWEVGARGLRGQIVKRSLPTRPWLNGHWPAHSQNNDCLSELSLSKFTCLCYLICSHNVPGSVRMLTRPEVVSPPFYTKRKLRQRVVIFTACPQRSGHLQDPKESLDVECLKKPSIPDFTSNSRAEEETKPLHQGRGKKGVAPLWTFPVPSQSSLASP